MLQLGVEMGRKHRGKPPPKVHDRIAALPVNAVVARAVVDDPYEKGAQIAVLRSLRDDPLARLHDRKQIGDVQFKAGRLWQNDYEAAEIGSARGIDPAKDQVDGGRFSELNTDRRLAAAARLLKDRRAIGQLGEVIITDVLGRGLMIKQAVEARGFMDRASMEFYSRLFRESLNTIAALRGLVLVHTARTRT
jgi:hypothetical protein